MDLLYYSLIVSKVNEKGKESECLVLMDKSIVELLKRMNVQTKKSLECKV